MVAADTVPPGPLVQFFVMFWSAFICSPIESMSSFKLLRNAWVPSMGTIITTFEAARSVRNIVLPSLQRIIGWANEAGFEDPFCVA